MTDSGDVDLMRSQLTIARGHLAQLPALASDKWRHPLEQARHAYETALNLLPRIKVSGTRRVELITELAKVRDSLLAAGVQL
jgi:hypothetical protein